MNENVSSTLFDILKQESQDIVLDQNLLNQMKKEINMWISRKNSLDKDLSEYVNEKEKYKHLSHDILTSKQFKVVLRQYQRSKKENKAFADISQIEEHIKDGYRLIQSVRKIFTGQDITYTIAFSKTVDKTTRIYEANLTLDQLLPQINVGKNRIENFIGKNSGSISDSLSLPITGGAVKKAIQAIENEEKQEIEFYSELRKPGLWDSLVERQKLFLQKNNLGRVFEAYKSLDAIGINYVGKGKRKNTLGLADAIFQRQRGENIEFYKQGDFGLEQLKAVIGSSTASLPSSGQIEKVLQEISQILDVTTKTELIQGLQKFFTPTDEKIVGDRFSQNVKEEAINAIERIVKEANLDIK